MKVVSYRIARVFNRSAASRAATLNISKTFKKVWHAALLHKIKSYGVLDQEFDLI